MDSAINSARSARNDTVKWYTTIAFALLTLLLCRTSGAQIVSSTKQTDSVEKIAIDFWIWRAKYAPFTSDDVPRIERPRLWRDWSPASISKRREDLAEFESRARKLQSGGWPVPQQVDYVLLGSALARVRWELDVDPRWKRDPNFYVEQTVTPILEDIVVPGPYDDSRSRDILERIENVPSIVESAKENLTTPPAPFVKAAIESLADIRTQLRRMAETGSQ